MKIEHVGYQVENPTEVARWYVDQLGFQVKRKMDRSPSAHFLADESGSVMIEIYNNPDAPVPDYASMDPLVLHLALVADDVEAHRSRLLRAGATAVGPTVRTPAGDLVSMLRDPWGFPIQLCKRAEPMLGQ